MTEHYGLRAVRRSGIISLPGRNSIKIFTIDLSYSLGDYWLC